MMNNLDDNEDISAEWTFNSGEFVSNSNQFASDWGGVLVAAGEDDDDDEDPDFTPVTKRMSKLKLELASPKMPEISEDKETESHATCTTFQDSFRSDFSSDHLDAASPKTPSSKKTSKATKERKTPKQHDGLSALDRARLTLSNRAAKDSVRSERKQRMKMSLNALAFTSLDQF